MLGQKKAKKKKKKIDDNNKLGVIQEKGKPISRNEYMTGRGYGRVRIQQKKKKNRV